MSKKEKNELVKIEGKLYKKQAFIIEDNHPAIGRILIVEGQKFKILDKDIIVGHKSGTFMKKLTEEDEQAMKDYDNAIDELSEKLIKKLDIKRLIQENIKNQSMQEIKTGLFILQAEEEGNKIEEEHHKGCYNFKMHYMNQCFELITGHDVDNNIIL